MRILVNALSATVGGGVTALSRLLPEMLASDGGRHAYLLLTRPQQLQSLGYSQRLERIEVRTGAGSMARAIAEQAIVPYQVLRKRADVLLSPAGLASFGSPVPQVLIFRNVAPFTESVVRQYKSTSNPKRMPRLRRMGILSAKVSNRVVFISDGQRDTIFPQLGIKAARTSRVYLGRAPEFDPQAALQAEATLKRLGIRCPYALSVSHFYRYQNLVELTEGFARATDALPSNLTLVLAGPELEPDYAARVKKTARAQGISDRIVFPGSIPYADLPALYASADLFLFSTSCESFPNTLVEALASGVPTLSSNHQPMPELAGDAARYFDASSPQDIAERLRQIWADETARKALGRAGVQRARRFSWRSTATELLAVLESAVAN